MELKINFVPTVGDSLSEGPVNRGSPPRKGQKKFIPFCTAFYDRLISSGGADCIPPMPSPRVLMRSHPFLVFGIQSSLFKLLCNLFEKLSYFKVLGT